MTSPIESIVVWAHRRRRTVFALSLIILLGSAAGLWRLRLDADVINLLPARGRAITPFRAYLQQFGTLDQLFVVFTAPDGRQITEYSTPVERWIAQLRAAPEIEWVDAGTAGPGRDWSWLADHQLLLLRGRTLDTALERLQPAGLTRALENSRQLLTVPSESVQQLVRQDPLDWFGLLRQQLGGARAGVSLGLTEAGYVSKDGRRRLVIAKPHRPPYDTAFSRQLVARLQEIAAGMREGAGPAVETTYAGGHLIALETEALVKRESIWNSVGSLALILPLLFLAFRSIWLLSAGAIPSMASLLIVLGLLGLTGVKLSAAATGSAAMLLGLGVDGVVLLYVAHRLALADGRTGAAAIAAIASPSASMLYGMLTTAATFYGLVFVDFPSLQQLGLLIGHSMVACGILTLILVPALLPARARGDGSHALLAWPRFAAWVAARRRVIVWAAAAATIGLGLAATRLHVNASLDRLRSTSPAAAYEEQVRRAFGLPSDVFVVLQHGRDLQPLLERNERLLAELHAASSSLAVDGGSSLLPSDAAQRAAHDTIGRAVGGADTAVARFNRHSAEAGFRPGSLQPFVDRLPLLLAADSHLAYDGFARHGLGDLIGRFVARTADGWTLASYAFPTSAADRRALESAVRSGDGTELTGLTLVNEELAARFMPQFVRGLAFGSIVVGVLIVLMFRSWRLSLLSVVPTVVGLVWAAGVLALCGVTLDLFAVFAVVTFVGIGVDYGIHVVHRFQDTGDAREAVAHLAPVIVVAGLITLFGYGTLMTSSYPPLRSMGIVSIVSVVALVAASLLLLPALLPASGSRRQAAGFPPPASALSPSREAPRRREYPMIVHALIPAFDEAETIGAVVTGLKPIVDAITVVDDGSTDGTADRARDAGATVIRQAEKGGKGTAVRAGLDVVLAGRCTHVLMIDGDLQHRPDEAPHLIEAARVTGADLVIGERQFDRASMPASRYHANRIGSRALSGFVGVTVGDTQCGFRLFAADALRGLPLRARGYEIETEMLVKVRRRGGIVVSAPVSAVYNGRPSKLRPIRDTTKTCFLAVYYRFLEPL